MTKDQIIGALKAAAIGGRGHHHFMDIGESLKPTSMKK